MTICQETADLTTPYGPMRTHVFRPTAEGHYPGILLYSEIFQITAPIARTAAMLAGHGFIVAAPEIYHEFLPAGEVLAYDQAGADKGNELKIAKELASYDADARAVLDYLTSHPNSTGNVGVMGICIGGHLSFRGAAKNPDVKAAVCFYATDIHKSSLGKGMADDTLESIKNTNAELAMFWGRQDPHVPLEGRRKIQATLDAEGLNYTWHEFNGQHAFLRDEGHRYDPELALRCYGMAIDVFRRKLGQGDVTTKVPSGVA